MAGFSLQALFNNLPNLIAEFTQIFTRHDARLDDHHERISALEQQMHAATRSASDAAGSGPTLPPDPFPPPPGGGE